MSSLGKRYARAAIEAARDLGGHEAIAAMSESLQHFTLSYMTSAELRELLNNPRLNDDRATVLADIFSELKLNTQTAHLINLLSDSERINLLPEISQQVEILADADAGRVRAEVRAATPLSEQQVQRIATALAKRYGAEVLVRVEVDSALLGGLVCRVGDDVWDSSVKRQLEALHEHF